jgi:hypothetical protein
MKQEALLKLCDKYGVSRDIALRVLHGFVFNGDVDSFVKSVQVCRLLRKANAQLALAFYQDEKFGKYGYDLNLFWFWSKDLKKSFIKEYGRALMAEDKDLCFGITLLLFGIGVLSYYLIRPLL